MVTSPNPRCKIGIHQALGRQSGLQAGRRRESEVTRVGDHVRNNLGNLGTRSRSINNTRYLCLCTYLPCRYPRDDSDALKCNIIKCWWLPSAALAGSSSLYSYLETRDSNPGQGVDAAKWYLILSPSPYPCLKLLWLFMLLALAHVPAQGYFI